jgi:asparagine synthase (glutamine-hydrolysing)
MCGISGIFTYESGTDFYPVMGKMTDSLAHRGPDDKGILIQDHIALGHRRLSIIDLSTAGHQPMSCDEGKFSIVFNGEIYNYKDIREELSKPTAIGPGVNFVTQSDTEVLLAAYKTYGKACLNRLNGMFSFAIWDFEKKELFIARDRMGIKPLYFYKDDEKLVFASELRAILKSGLVRKKVNQKGLSDYLRYQTVHAPDTIIEGVQMLLPGHYIQINEEDFIIKKYWDAIEEAQKEFIPTDYSILCAKVKDLLFQSVERRLVADVPFGAFLSGGIDSSAIVAIMSQVSGQKVNTFNISFKEEAFSEAQYAKKVAQRYGTSHTEIKLSPNDFLKALPEALNALDHPSGDGLNTWLVSKKTKEAGVTMALSGLGGDELFAGYDIFKRMYDIGDKKWLLSFPVFARRLMGGLLKTLKPGVASDKTAEILIQDYFDLSYVYPFSRQVLLDSQVYRLLDKQLLHENAVKKIIEDNLQYGKPGFSLPFLSKVSIAEMYTYMQNVLLRDTDQMSMAHSLEVRVPFLDHTLVKFVLAVEDKQKYPHSPKKLLVDAMGGLLPKEIVDRPKMGFVFPWQIWMKHELKNFCSEKLEAFGKRDGISKKELQSLWKRFLNNDKSITWSRIWYLVVLEHWLEENGVEM